MPRRRRKSNWRKKVTTKKLFAVLFILLLIGGFVFFRFFWNNVSDTYVPPNYEVYGIDISHHQRNVDWQKLTKARLSGHPISFVILKATEGKTFRDKQFKARFRLAHSNGFVRGAYHFFLPHVDGELQATNYINNVALQKGDLPPILDVEQRGTVQRDVFRTRVMTCLHRLEQHYGVKPIIYVSYSFLRDHLDGLALSDYPLWIAQYRTRKPSIRGLWYFWQFSEKGSVDGIDGYVDCNVFSGSAEDLKQFCIH